MGRVNEKRARARGVGRRPQAEVQWVVRIDRPDQPVSGAWSSSFSIMKAIKASQLSKHR